MSEVSDSCQVLLLLRSLCHYSFLKEITHGMTSLGFPGGARGKELTCQCRRCKRCGLDPWVRKIPWRREGQPTPVFLSGESHGQRSQAGYIVHGNHEESDTSEQLSFLFFLASQKNLSWDLQVSNPTQVKASVHT